MSTRRRTYYYGGNNMPRYFTTNASDEYPVIFDYDTLEAHDLESISSGTDYYDLLQISSYDPIGDIFTVYKSRTTLTLGKVNYISSYTIPQVGETVSAVQDYYTSVYYPKTRELISSDYIKWAINGKFVSLFINTNDLTTLYDVYLVVTDLNNVVIDSVFISQAQDFDYTYNDGIPDCVQIIEVHDKIVYLRSRIYTDLYEGYWKIHTYNTETMELNVLLEDALSSSPVINVY